MTTAGNDRVLRAALVGLGLDTVASMALAVSGIPGDGEPGHHSAVRFGLALAWFGVLLVALWRAARDTRALRRILRWREGEVAAEDVTAHEWVWDARVVHEPRFDLVFTSSNQSVTKLLGYEPPDVIGMSVFDVLREEHRATALALVAEAMQDKCGWEAVELQWRHREGHLVGLVETAVPLFDPRGRISGYRGTRHLAPVDFESRRRRAVIAHRVKQAIEHRRPQMALQPIISLETGLLAGVEALCRFSDLRPPNVWFAEAHEVGAGLDLELAAVEQALATVTELPPGAFLSVNASPALIVDPRLAKMVSASGVAPDRVVIEITEHMAIEHYGGIDSALRPLRDLGLRLAIDDTGAGYASFHHVLSLRPDVIKLDRSLITNIDLDPARRAFVVAILLLGIELNASVTAEGIESPGELAVLRTIGVDHGQGHLLAHPTSSRSEWRSWGGEAIPWAGAFGFACV